MTNESLCKALKNYNCLEFYLDPVLNNECYVSIQFRNNYKFWHNSLCHLNAKFIANMKEYIDLHMDGMNNFIFVVCDISKTTR